MARKIFPPDKLHDARMCLELDGGWLLRRRDGETEWTDDEDYVVGRKGWAWVEECDRQSCWDETRGIVYDHCQGH